MSEFTFRLTTTQGEETFYGSAADVLEARREAVLFLADLLRDETQKGFAASLLVEACEEGKPFFRISATLGDVAI